MNCVIKNDFYTVTVNRLGAELISIVSKDGKELLWQSPSDKYWSKHAPLLFPVCGRLKDRKYSYGGKIYDMAAHGFISKRVFELKSVTDTSVELVSRSDCETLSQYPFEFTFTAKYTLKDNELLCEVSVKNDGEELMPYMFGWHPAFALPTEDGADIEDYEIELGKESVSWIKLINGPFAARVAVPFKTEGGSYRLNEEQIYANDTMIFTDVSPRARLTAKGHPYSLDIKWSDTQPYLCVWKEPHHEAKFICLEPWTDVPGNGVDDEVFETRKMRRLAPGVTESYFYSFKFTL